MFLISSRYILRLIFAYSVPMLAVALIALLLERMLRLHHTESERVQLVLLPTAVTDRRGRAVRGLEATDFRLFEDQVASRQLDVAARRLKKRAEGYYTIASAGHERNAILGYELALDDQVVEPGPPGAAPVHSRGIGNPDLLGLVDERDQIVSPATPNQK